MTLTLLKDGKPLFTEQGEALFTHFGISGPLVLSASTILMMCSCTAILQSLT